MRAKIIIPNLLVVLLMGTGLFGYLHYHLKRNYQTELQQKLRTVSSLFIRSEALRRHEQLQHVSRLALSKTVSGVFNVLDMAQMAEETQLAYEQRMRDAWFKKALTAVETSAVTLAQKGREPALVFITDRYGVVLARNTTPNACPAGRNVADAMPVVKRALDGEPDFRIWSAKNSPFDGNNRGNEHLCSLMNAGLLELAAAPIWSQDDQVAGVIVVGYEVSNGMAAEKSAEIGVQLSVVHDKEVYSTSFQTDEAREALSQSLQSAPVSAQLRNAFKGKQNGSLKTFDVSLQDKKYLGIATMVPNTYPGERVAFVFLSDASMESVLKPITMVVWGMVIVAGLLVFVIGVLLGNHFIRPVVEIEEGLLKIINGDETYRFDVESDEVGGLSYRINQLVNALTGSDDENGEDS